MKRPSFPFYHGDWRANAKLRRCSHAERGIWLEAMCLMADSDEFGILRWPLKDLSNAVPCRLAELRKLVAKGVMKGADVGETCKAEVYTPRHAGKSGEPVILVPEQPGPIWYSSRMVRDEYVRTLRATQGGAESKPKVGIGDGSGDHPSRVRARAPARSFPSSSPEESKDSPASAGGGLPACPHEQIVAIYHEILPECPRVIEWNDRRQTLMRTRWREKAKPNGRSQGYTTTEDGLRYWRRFFTFVSQSKFLTGKAPPQPGRAPFVASLEWLITPSNFAKVVEGNYNPTEGQPQ